MKERQKSINDKSFLQQDTGFLRSFKRYKYQQVLINENIVVHTEQVKAKRWIVIA